MAKLEARIRVHASNELINLFEIAVDDFWRENGCYKPKEAFCILHYKVGNKGKIVEADYRGGPTEFKEKANYDNIPLANIPTSIIEAAYMPIELDEETKAMLRQAHREKAEDMIEMSVLQPTHFKPLSDRDLEYIRKNCFRL